MPTVAIKGDLKFLANLDEPLVYIPSRGGGDETDHAGNFTTQEVSVYDATTLRAEDLISMERRAEDRIGELQVALHDSGRLNLGDRAWEGAPVGNSTFEGGAA